MKIFVLNSGSSSIKYKLFLYRDREFKIINSGLIEHIGEGKEYPKNHKEALELIDEDFNSFDIIAHRVVHGGSYFTKATIINQDVIDKIEKVSYLAPIHNPANLEGIKALSKVNTTQIAFFDTAFHQTMPIESYRYAIGENFSNIRRYGFHGISHQYLAKEASKLLNKPLNRCNLITLHLGNGASATAIKNGKSIDTSMGFTPLEGLVMGSRSGDIDAGVIIYLAKELNKSPEEIEHILNYESGLKAICGTNDMREIIKNSKNGDKRSQLAFKIFCNRVKKYIGAYIALIGRVDAIIFSGGIGENSQEVRDEICNNMEHLGISKDKNSPISIFTIKTNEELEMAKGSLEIIRA